MKFIARDGVTEREVEVQRHGAGYRVRIGERSMDVDFITAGHFLRSLRLEDGTQFSLIHHSEGFSHEVTIGATTVRVEIVDPLVARRKRGEDEMGGGGVIKALMPGRVVRLLVEKGATVRKGAGLLILEAMKMENEIQAQTDGVIDEIFVTSGQTVEAGAELVHLVKAE